MCLFETIIMKKYKRRTPIEKLEKHKLVDNETGCWNWTVDLIKIDMEKY